MDEPLIVLMTACIAPKSGVKEHLQRSNPAVRLQDYEAALRFWLTLDEPLIKGILFADNSGHPLKSLYHIASEMGGRRPVEFLSFDAPPPPPGINYGYNEFILVNDALAHSQLASTARYFIKATGRYQFPDISRLLHRLPQNFRVAVDCRGVWPIGRSSQPLVTTALALFDRTFYLENLAALPHYMRPAPPWNGRRHYIEFMLFDALYPRRNEAGIVLRWPRNCEASGIGANGDNYNAPRKHLTRTIRALTRMFCPPLWV